MGLYFPKRRKFCTARDVFPHGGKRDPMEIFQMSEGFSDPKIRPDHSINVLSTKIEPCDFLVLPH